MFVARTSMLGTAAALLLGLSACATTRSALTGSTLDLQHSANTLAEDASNLPPPADEEYAVDVNYARDAHELAESARELRHTVQEGGSDADVRMAFNRVSRSFHAVRDEVHHSDSERARADLRPVEAAYDDVQHDLGEYSGYPAS